MKTIFNKLGFLKSNCFVFIYFLLIVLIWTYPIVLLLNTKILGYHDAWQFIWNFWWVKTALLDLHTNLFFTNYIHWPNGISLLFHTLNLSNSVMSIPLQYFFGLTLTYNILALLNLAFNGFATYLLAYYFTRNKFASFVAGYIVAFSPYMFAHALGHLNLISFGWVVLGILYFIKMTKGEARWYLPALFITITGLTDWYYFFYLVIFIILYLVFLLIKERNVYTDRKFQKNLFLVIVTVLFFIGPYLGSMIYLKLKTGDFNEIVHKSIDNSIDLTALFVPNAPSYFFHDHFYSFWKKWNWTWEGIGYLGYTVFLLVIYTIAKIKKSRKIIIFWLISAFLFLVLSLGPYLHINGVIYKNIVLPYYFFEKMPFMSIQGMPARFMIMVYLLLAVLASFAINDIMSLKTKLKYFILGIISVLVIIEYLPAKLVISKIKIPEYYQTIKSEDGDFAIIDVGTEEAQVQFFQTIHKKRLIGGYTSRPSQKAINFLEQTPIIFNIYHGIDEPGIYSDLEKSKSVLKEYKIKYIIVSEKDTTKYKINKIRRSILEKLQIPIVWQNSGIIIYKVY